MTVIYPEIGVESQIGIGIGGFLQFVENGSQVGPDGASIFIRQFHGFARVAIGVGATQNVGVKSLSGTLKE